MRRTLLALLVLPLLAACDLFGPSGPGEVTARIDAPNARVGAAVVQVKGSGVKGFSAAGGARVFSRRVDGPDTYRVVVVEPDGGDLAFRIEVEDVAAPPPSALIFSAADTADEPLPAEAGVRVTIQK